MNGYLYLGKDEIRPNGQCLGENVVHCLVENYKNTGRNITTDSFFTSLKLAKCLRTNGLGCWNNKSCKKRSSFSFEKCAK